jgi:TPR repeat protein
MKYLTVNLFFLLLFTSVIQAQMSVADSLWNSKSYEKAFEIYKKESDLGNINATSILSFCYYKGLGTYIDIEKAFELAQKAQKGGSLFSNGILASIYENRNDTLEAEKYYQIVLDKKELFEKNDVGLVLLCWANSFKNNYAEVYKYAKISADKGFAPGQNILGGCYSNGTGVTEDKTESVKWYIKAAEQGYADAQTQLGYMYSNGIGVKKDDAEAVKWYIKAANQGHARGQNNLGVKYMKGLGVTKNESEALKWFRKSAEQGDEMGQRALGNMYFNGQALEKNEAEAFKWYKKAAEQDYADSQFELGSMFEDGVGVKKDLIEAIKWYKKAAEQGNSNALNNLGLIYQYESLNLGYYRSSNDMEEALKLYRESAEQGNAFGQYNLANMFSNGIGINENQTEAAKWYKKSAEQGYAEAQTKLGYMYESGIGLNKDLEEAKKWYKKAADQGNETAIENLKVLASMSFEEIQLKVQDLKSMLNNKEIPWVGEFEAYIPFENVGQLIKKEDLYQALSNSVNGINNLDLYSKEFIDSMGIEGFRSAVTKQLIENYNFIEDFYPKTFIQYLLIEARNNKNIAFKDSDLSRRVNKDELNEILTERDTTYTQDPETFEYVMQVYEQNFNIHDFKLCKIKFHLYFDSNKNNWNILPYSIAPVACKYDDNGGFIGISTTCWFPIQNIVDDFNINDANITSSRKTELRINFSKVKIIKGDKNYLAYNKTMLNDIQQNPQKHEVFNFSMNRINNDILKNYEVTDTIITNDPETSTEIIKTEKHKLDHFIPFNEIVFIQDWYWDNKEKKLKTKTEYRRPGNLMFYIKK